MSYNGRPYISTCYYLPPHTGVHTDERIPHTLPRKRAERLRCTVNAPRHDCYPGERNPCGSRVGLGHPIRGPANAERGDTVDRNLAIGRILPATEGRDTAVPYRDERVIAGAIPSTGTGIVRLDTRTAEHPAERTIRPLDEVDPEERSAACLDELFGGEEVDCRRCRAESQCVHDVSFRGFL